MTQNEHNKTAQIVQGLVDELREAKKTIKEKEQEISTLKARTKEIEEVQIPDILFESGQKGITLFSGSRVDVKPFYFARTLKDNPQPFYSWLRDNGHGALIKAHFEEWMTNPQEVELLKDLFQEFHVQYDLSEGIHWKTLESWFKEQTEKGAQLPTQLFENYVGRKASVK